MHEILFLIKTSTMLVDPDPDPDVILCHNLVIEQWIGVGIRWHEDYFTALRK